MITNTNLTYIAGYIDGDGCFYIGKTTNKKTGRVRYQSMIVISSTNKETLKYFAKQYSGTYRMSDNRINYPGQKIQYQFTLKGKKALQFAKDILIYLVEKNCQAKLFIDFMEAQHDYTRDSNIEFMHRLKHEFHFVSESDKDIFLKESYYKKACEFDYAYLAGFIDAECCLSIQHYKPKDRPNVVYKIYLGCNNTKWPIFKWLIHRFGGALHFINRVQKNPKHHNQLQWRLSGRVLADILPFVSKYLINKKSVCEQLIKFYATTLPNGGARHTEIFRESYSKVIKERERIVHEVHRLNKKGI